MKRNPSVSRERKHLPRTSCHVVRDAEHDQNDEQTRDSRRSLGGSSSGGEDLDEREPGGGSECIGEVCKAETVGDEHHEDHEAVDEVAQDHGLWDDV